MCSYREAPRFERVASCFGDPGRGPRRIPHDVDPDFAYAGLPQETLAHVVENEVACGAAHRRECEVDFHHTCFFTNSIDDSEIDEIHRHLRILEFRQRGPEPLDHQSWWCAFRKLWNSSWNIATISALRGPRSRQRPSTSSQVMGCLKSQRLASASNSQGKG